jgi:hypothetical protein
MEEQTETYSLPRVQGFWTWLARKDPQGDRGVANLANWWNALGVFASAILAAEANLPASELARGVALPGAAALVGLSFAWAGRSSSLLQDRDFSEFIIQHGPPVEGYVYSFQLAVLTVAIFIVVSLSLVAGGLDISLGSQKADAIGNRFLLFAFGFIAAHECWGVIYFANKLSIQFLKIRELKNSS